MTCSSWTGCPATPVPNLAQDLKKVSINIHLKTKSVKNMMRFWMTLIQWQWIFPTVLSAAFLFWDWLDWLDWPKVVTRTSQWLHEKLAHLKIKKKKNATVWITPQPLSQLSFSRVGRLGRVKKSSGDHFISLISKLDNNKLASLEATLIPNYHRLTYSQGWGVELLA